MPRIKISPPSARCTSRHLIYRSSPFSLDVRLDFRPDSDEIDLVGQLVGRDSMPLAEVPVFTIAGDRRLARSLTGRLGEFRLRSRRSDQVRLCLSLDDEGLVEIELDQRRMTRSSRPLLIDTLFDDRQPRQSGHETQADLSQTA